MKGQAPLLGVVTDPPARERTEPLPTRQQCIDEAGEVYGRILADPERAEQLLAHRAAKRVAASQAQ